MTNPPGFYCKNRLFEWTMASMLLGMSILLIIWPRSIDGSKFQFMLDVIGSRSLMWFYLMVGGARALALFYNGRWGVWGAVIRSAGAIGGAMVWTQMGISLILSQYAMAGLPPPSLPIYLSLVVAELISAYRAAADARYR